MKNTYYLALDDKERSMQATKILYSRTPKVLVRFAFRRANGERLRELHIYKAGCMHS